MTKLDHADQLRSTAQTLSNAYASAYQDLATRHTDPLKVVTTDGRYILLDALTALVNAQSALARLDHP